MDGEVHDGDEAHAEGAGQRADRAGHPVVGPAADTNNFCIVKKFSVLAELIIEYFMHLKVLLSTDTDIIFYCTRPYMQ